MPKESPTDVQQLHHENTELRARLETLERERNEMLIGLEKLGWPCRLGELPAYVKSLSDLLESTRNELAVTKRARR